MGYLPFRICYLILYPSDTRNCIYLYYSTRELWVEKHSFDWAIFNPILMTFDFIFSWICGYRMKIVWKNVDVMFYYFQKKILSWFAVVFKYFNIKANNIHFNPAAFLEVFCGPPVENHCVRHKIENHINGPWSKISPGMYFWHHFWKYSNIIWTMHRNGLVHTKWIKDNLWSQSKRYIQRWIFFF